jgi:two-component sensor histidine kinase
MASGCAGVLAVVVIWNAEVHGRAERAYGDIAQDDRFLAALTEVIYSTEDPEQIFDQVSARLGKHLGLARCYFADIDVANDRCFVNRDFHHGVRSAAGEYVVSSFNSNVAAMRQGQGVVNCDTRLDPRSLSRFALTFQPMAMRAYVSIPHLQDGEWVGSLVASAAQPRAWRDHEVGVVRAVSERTWLWVEHLRIVDALRDSEARQAALLAELRTANADLEHRVRARTAELSATLKEREVMLQEIHHRVKNNLQVISSLINMQVRRLEPGITQDALAECQTRVLAIALIHEKLYQSKDYSHVRFAEYARSLAANVFHATGISQQEVELELAIEDIPLGIDRAIPCGLVINELISNALKHGFKHGRAGKIRIELTRLDDGNLRLTVSDDGVGLPDSFDVHGLASMGLQLVCTLSEQLDATLVVDGKHGASFQLTFAGSS